MADGIQSDLVTVVIPVRDRAGTIADTLRSCEAQSDVRFRVLISDNYSGDSTATVADEFVRRDKRFKLVQPPEPMAMTQHWSWVLDQVGEGWVMLLGADDGLLPDSVNGLRALLSKYPDAECVSGGFAVYYYPDLPTEKAGEIGFPIDSKSSNVDGRVLLKGAASFREGPGVLPIPYAKAFVKTSVLARIKEKSGAFISSPTPDYYLGIAIASEAKKLVISSRPLALAGVSSSGNGAKCLFPEMGNALDTAVAFVNDGSVKWHSSVPYAPFIQFAVAEAIVQAKIAGVVDDNVVISWDRCIAQSFMAFTKGSWSEAEGKRILDCLLQACRNFGASELESRIRQRIDPENDALIQSLVRVEPAGADFVSFSTTQLGTRNVWQASGLISVFLSQLDGGKKSVSNQCRDFLRRVLRKTVSLVAGLQSLNHR